MADQNAHEKADYDDPIAPSHDDDAPMTPEVEEDWEEWAKGKGGTRIKRMAFADWMDSAQVSKIIRGVLKESFPGTKFSVKTNKYAGGASIDIRWIDGPPSKAVDALVKKFEGADFDGMIDLKTYNDPVQHGDMTFNSGADYVFTERSLSVGLATQWVAEQCAKYGLDASLVNITTWGTDGAASIDTQGLGWEMGDIIRRQVGVMRQERYPDGTWMNGKPGHVAQVFPSAEPFYSGIRDGYCPFCSSAGTVNSQGDSIGCMVCGSTWSDEDDYQADLLAERYPQDPIVAVGQSIPGYDEWKLAPSPTAEEGTCPGCGAEGVVGETCPDCGEYTIPTQQELDEAAAESEWEARRNEEGW